MTLAIRIDDIPKPEWERLAAGFADHNFCQSWEYGQARAEDTGSRSSRGVVFDGGRAVLMAECRIKMIPFIGTGMAYVSGGPLYRAAGGAGHLREALFLLRDEYVKRRGLVLRFSPKVLDEDASEVIGAFTECGFELEAEGEKYRTVVLDLARPLDEIRKGLRQKWRNALNRSEKEGLSVRMGREPELFNDFEALYGELLKRKAFDAPLGADFYARLQGRLPREEKLDVAIAYKGGTPVAGHVSSMLGDTCVYVLGASNDDGLAAKAAYLLQWAVVTEAVRRGMTRYDLGGIDPEGNPGVYHFKSGIGGREITAPGPFEAAPSTARKRFVTAAETLYRRVKGAARRAPARPAGLSAAGRTLQSVLCLGGEDWWYHNHGHIDMQIMKRFAAVAPVLYVNSIVMRKFNVGEGRMFLARVARKAKSIFCGAKEVMPNFHVYSPVSLPVHHVALAREFNERLVRMQVTMAMRARRMARPLVWVACPAACDVALGISRTALVYQRTDKYEDYPGVDREQIIRYDRTLKSAADVTFYVNHRMMAEEAGQCRRAVFIDHGVDYDAFAGAADDATVLAEMAQLKRPIVGFFGDIDSHIVDVEMLEELTRLLPEMSFAFVGTSTVDTSTLAARPNVTMIPRRPYEVIPQYGKCFDVALMPWRENEWIESCNPIKLKEYLALGKPVVSTPFSELEYYNGVVERARGAREFADAIVRALAEDSPEMAAARRSRVAAITWDTRARLALETVGLKGL